MRNDWNGVLTCVCGQALSPKSSLHKDVTAATADRTVSARLKRKLTELEELWEFDLNWLHNVICCSAVSLLSDVLLIHLLMR